MLRLISKGGLSPGMIVDVFKDQDNRFQRVGKATLKWVKPGPKRQTRRVYIYEYWTVSFKGIELNLWARGRRYVKTPK